jgi:hypothetical protein
MINQSLGNNNKTKTMQLTIKLGGFHGSHFLNENVGEGEDHLSFLHNLSGDALGNTGKRKLV